MAYEQKPNSGSLFPPSEKAPPSVQLSGTINVDGKLYFITMWKKDKAEQKHWNVTVKPKQTDYQETPRDTDTREGMAPGPGFSDAPDDEIPF